MEEKTQRFYSWDDCRRCNGTGWVAIAECPCSSCRRRYVEELERMVSDCVSLADVMRDGYNEQLVEFAARGVNARAAALIDQT